MSEYQYVAFRAVDRPLDKKALAYMKRQSSRAEITPWSFDNEYHFGDFHGNPFKMLLRGYDLHLHYASFGIRKVMFRFAAGTLKKPSLAAYLSDGCLRSFMDHTGKGDILTIDPLREDYGFDDQWELESEIEEIVERLVAVRAEILAGDLRPLYIAHLAVACDDHHDPDETHEAPVPAGLEKLTRAQRTLAEYLGLSTSMLKAAAVSGSSPRTIAEMHALEEQAAPDAEKKAAAKAARLRQIRLAEMTKAPSKTLRETERLVAQRSSQSYKLAAELLVDLREALAETEQSELAVKHAEKLRAANPTLHFLASELRKRQLIAK